MTEILDHFSNLVGLPSPFTPQECDYCGVRGVSLPVCECGESYCSPACRLAEWKNHKEVRISFASLNSRFSRVFIELLVKPGLTVKLIIV